MIVGMHADGRQVEYTPETEQYTVGEQPITLKEVLGFAGAGELTWASDELREWARGLVSGNPAPPATTSTPTAEVPIATSDKTAGWFTRLPLWGKRIRHGICCGTRSQHHDGIPGKCCGARSTEAEHRLGPPHRNGQCSKRTSWAVRAFGASTTSVHLVGQFSGSSSLS